MGSADAPATVEGPLVDRPIQSLSPPPVSDEVEVMDKANAPATEEMVEDSSLLTKGVVLGAEVDDVDKSMPRFARRSAL